MNRPFRVVNLVSMACFALAVLFLGSTDTSAQIRWDDGRDRNRSERRLRQHRDDRQTRQRDHPVSRRDVNTIVLQGYEQGLRAGQNDRRRGKLNASNVYRNTPARPYSGDASSADYLYRQGYLEGYQDGYYGRIRY